MFIKTYLPTLLPALVFLSACSPPDAQSDLDRAAVDIGDLTAGGAQVQTFRTPAGFEQGDKLVAYEGPGWESDRVAYRLYLDGRNAIDIFGKRTSDLVLSKVGRGEDYHTMADWGMDILKVGNSLGAGGFGVYKNGEVVQIGEAESYSAEVVEDLSDRASLKVTHQASVACGQDVSAVYEIEAGSRLTDVTVTPGCRLPIAAGLIIHPGTRDIASSPDTGWGYIARYGAQSLVPDNLGFAIFYKAEDIESIGKDSDDDYIVFKSGVTPHYKTGSVWAQEIDAVKTSADFSAWLIDTQKRLNAQDKS